MDLDFFNNLINNVKENDFAQNFLNELSNFIENNSKLDIINNSTKYSKYWEYQNFIEDNVSARIGLSKWSSDIMYNDEISKAVNDTILELAEKEGTLYRKQFRANGSQKGNFYNIDKFENGKVEHLRIPANEIPSQYKDEDIVFQYKKDGEIKVRNDLKDNIVNLASRKCSNLKLKEDEKAKNFKREGHIYQAFEDDGYIFLKDLTKEREYLLEDIDFIVDCYEGEGKYQVIDGEYKKIVG